MTIRFIRITLLLLIFPILGARAQDTLLLFHPTVYNLELFTQLNREGIFNLEGYHILGVYHSLEQYDYDQVLAYLDSCPAENMSLQEIRGKLDPGLVFKSNECSPQFKKLFIISKGALFMGGPDIPAEVYGEPVHLLTHVTDPFRHFCEASYLFHLLGGDQDPQWIPFMKEKPSYLISGICLGMQTLNVATGGTLTQNIPSAIYGMWQVETILDQDPNQMHRNYHDKIYSGCEAPTSYHFHAIQLEKKSFLTRGIGIRNRITPLVLSSHHQAVKRVGQGLTVSALSMDGKIIEAVEHKRYPHVFGVQFHPEKPGLFDPSIKHPNTCSSTINFQAAIEGSSSYDFHLAYWNFLGNILQNLRTSR